MKNLPFQCSNPGCKAHLYVSTNQVGKPIKLECPLCRASRVVRITNNENMVVENTKGLPRDPYVSVSPWDPVKEAQRKAQKRAAEEKQRKADVFKKSIFEQSGNVQVKKAASAQEIVYMCVASAQIDELNHSISHYPELLQGCPANMAPIEYVLGNAFPENARQNYIVSNYIYQREDEVKRYNIAIRTVLPARYKNVLGTRQIRVEGHIGRNTFYVGRISVVETSPLTSNEKQMQFAVRHSEPTTADQFIWQMIEQIKNYSTEMSGELKEWNDYLVWKQKLIEMRISGIKYLGFRLEEVEDDFPEISFLAVVPSKEERRKAERILRAGDLKVYSNSISRDRWEFIYDMSNTGRYDYGTELELVRFDEINPVIASDWEEYLQYSRQPEEGKQKLGIRQAMRAIQEHPAYEDPCYYKIVFKLPDEIYNALEYHQNDLYDYEAQAEYVASAFLPELNFDGYIATSRVGDFALNRRLKSGLDDLQAGKSESANLGKWIFDIKKANNFTPTDIDVQWSEWGERHLNEPQKQIIKKMMLSPDVFLCQGPPGTGKTTVIAEAVYQFTKQGKRVLIASQTNLAVNNALSKLITHPSIRAVRLGSASKIDESVEHITEENILKTFYTGVRDQIVRKYIEPWSEADRELHVIALDEEYLKDIYKRIQEQFSAWETAKTELEATEQGIQKEIARDKDSERELTQVRMEHLQNRAAELSHGQFSGSLSLGKEQASSLAQLIWPCLISLRTAGYSVIPEYMDESFDSDDYSSRELCKVIGDALKLSTGIRISDIQLEDAIVRRIRELKAEKAELVNGELDEKDIIRLKEVNNELKELNVDPWEGIAAFLPEQYKAAMNSGALPDNLRDEVRTQIGNTATELIGKSKRFFEEEIQLLSQNIQEDENRLATLRMKKKEQEELVASLHDELEQTKEELDELANTYQCEVKEGAIERAMAAKKAQIEKSIPGDRSDFEEFLNEFVDYIDELDGDFALENEVYLNSYINACNVVGVSCTENSLTLSQKGFNAFDVVIIDEVSKATPPEILLPLLMAKKAILVGDHRQLPPLFGEHQTSYQEYVNELDEDDEESRQLLSAENYKRFESLVTNSLFRRHYEQANPNIKGALLVQYRMHRDIMNVINMFYDGKLRAGYSEDEEQSVKSHGVTIRSPKSNAALVTADHHAYWFDSSSFAGREVYETRKKGGTSMFNRLEVAIITELVRQINSSYADREKPAEIGIISFYMEQVNMVREALRKMKLEHVRYEVNTVDRFQGKEKPIVIVSLVRNVKVGRRYDASYVKAYERINVAFSRAQNLLAIVGSSNMYEGEEIVIKDMETGKDLPPRRVYKDIMDRLALQGCFISADDILDPNAEDAVFPREVR